MTSLVSPLPPTHPVTQLRKPFPQSKKLLTILRMGLVHSSLRVHAFFLQDPFTLSAFPPSLPSEAFQSSAVTISLSSSLQLQTESVVSSAPIGALLYRTLMHTPF